MKIALVVRSDFDQFMGGDVTHAFLLKRFLEQAGVRVELARCTSPLGGFDLCHAFNIVRPYEAFVVSESCRESGIPFVLSPIFDDINEMNFPRKTPLFRLALTFGRSAMEAAKFAYLKIFRRNPDMELRLIDSVESVRRRLISNCDGIVTWSNWEANYLSEKFGGRKYYTARAGANHLSTVTAPKERMVICVGLFSDRKNQEMLVRAARYFNCKFVFVGRPAPGYGWYYDRCRKIAPQNCEFAGFVQAEEISRLYARAKVFALPSLWEAAGLAGLEAANFGCNLVISDIPVLREYFPGMAYFCDPQSLESVVRMLADALNDRNDARGGKSFVGTNYKWEDITASLLQFYTMLCR